MVEFLKKLLRGNAPLQDLVKHGAQIIDVRTPAEYASGHLKTAVNIPLGDLMNKMPVINKNIPIVLCCTSGVRSRSAVNMLKGYGFHNVYDGGSWTRLKKYEV